MYPMPQQEAEVRQNDAKLFSLLPVSLALLIIQTTVPQLIKIQSWSTLSIWTHVTQRVQPLK
jgi:hypothetical protein